MNDPHHTDLKHDAIAAEVLDAADAARQIAPFSERLAAAFTMPDAYAVTAAVRRRREARGECPVGRKIGFTNRTIWDTYGVHAPIWSYMYDSTVLEQADCADGLDLAPFLEPRLEPEIAFGMAAAPRPDMDEAALLDCIAWVAHGFEVVQSLYPGWRFAAPDTVAGFGMHGAYVIGPRRPVAEAPPGGWLDALAQFRIVLRRDGEVAGRGEAANVLGGPLSALRHLVGLLAEDVHNPPLAAGEVVTTGTLTDAFPVAAGECWLTELEGLPLAGIELRFR